MSTCLLFRDDAVSFTPRFRCFTEYTPTGEDMQVAIYKPKMAVLSRILELLLQSQHEL